MGLSFKVGEDGERWVPGANGRQRGLARGSQGDEQTVTRSTGRRCWAGRAESGVCRAVDHSMDSSLDSICSV